MTSPTMTPAAVRSALRAKTEIAILDVREESRFAGGHPLFAASFPLGHLEAQAAERVVALANGTIGWTLAGLDLDHGQARRAPDVSGETAGRAEAAAWAVADLAGVRRLGEGASPAPDDGKRTVYRFDVRTPQEYENGHRPGFRPAPGGQLVQETDWYAPVLTSPDGYLAAWAAADLSAGAGRTRILALAGGTQGWASSGRALESGQSELLSPALDVYRRPYEGTGVDPAVMQAYLDWEYGLVAQLGRDGTHGFRVLTRERGLTTAGPTGSAG